MGREPNPKNMDPSLRPVDVAPLPKVHVPECSNGGVACPETIPNLLLQYAGAIFNPTL